MTPAQADLIHVLRPVLGVGGVVTEPADIEPWLTDWRCRFRGAAPALIAPDTREGVQAVVQAAAERHVPLVPQGGNTSMVGGATPPEDGSALILSTRRLNRLRSLDAGGGLAVAEAGVILTDLHTAALLAGRRFPLTLGARGSATIGGLVSTNAGGTQVLRFGTMRGLVAGVEAVLPDGTIHDGLAPLKKDNRGYDIGQLLIGAEGTLGIVTAATLRLVPAIAERAVAWAGVTSPHQGLALLRSLQAATDSIESFEIMPAETLSAALAHLPGARSPLAGEHRWHLLIEAVSTDPAAVSPSVLLQGLLGTALDDGQIEDAVIAQSEAQAEAFWRLRDSLSDAERATGPAVQHDIAVPVDAMPDFMIEAARHVEARFPGTRASGFGHLGDGNIHFHVRAPAGAERQAWQAAEGPPISRYVHDLVVAAGGTISAEHGIGQMKRDELARVSPPGRIAALRAIKQAFDPDWLFNPGKLVALAPVRPRS
ncbi:FAD/FMN-containing dehydrogenase [Sphingomonas gellani]|uniref:FAD/FMN-containing dehydrogenase n=1 Tax=Sphingomonas gellani TaxID=1166340 RepID=A0A1H8BJ10_9SPHN|nr:FAD-binding oxidoreductase [Sphingomonas gellani]SEM82469.1 FAD/FMN-containing dehydrogenase [Sphingomonas gellani]